MQLDRTERIDKLEQALGGVEADYARLLRAFDSRSESSSTQAARASTGDMRPLEEDDEEPGAKKIKFT